MKLKLVPYENLWNLKEIVIAPEKTQEILNEFIQALQNGTLYNI